MYRVRCRDILRILEPRFVPLRLICGIKLELKTGAWEELRDSAKFGEFQCRLNLPQRDESIDIGFEDWPLSPRPKRLIHVGIYTAWRHVPNEVSGRST